MGLNATLATAGQSLNVFSAGIQVAGQNVANANTPGYIRESLNLETNLPYRSDGVVFGTGVRIGGLQQEIDKFLETRIHAANSDVGTAKVREDIYHQLEFEIRELGDGDLSTGLNDFLAAINDVVNQPEVATNRQTAIEVGRQLADQISSLRIRIDNARLAQSTQLESLVGEANSLVDTVEQLNPQITTLEAGGRAQSDAGALRTERYIALNRLSEIIPIEYVERANGAVDISVASDYLLLAGQKQTLELDGQIDRGIGVQTVRLSKTNASFTVNGGELRGIIEGRDGILGGFVDQLDAFASNLINEFNQIHTSGEGLNGFTTVTSASRVDDTSTALNAAGLAFTPQHGSFQLQVTNLLNGTTETTDISVDLDGIGSDTTLDDLRAAIDAVGNVSASLTTDRRLKLDAGANTEIRFRNDTSGVLASLGINTFFTGSDSRNIDVNKSVIDNHGLLATGQGGGPSDNRNVARLAQFIDGPVAALGGVSIDEFYNSVISSVAQGSSSESAIASGFEGFRESLLNQREQYSGVSLDEEAIRIMEFQHAFQASARMISTVDELFQILLRV